MEDTFEIKKIFEIGLAKELNFIISKRGINLYVFSNLDASKKDHLKKFMNGRLDISYGKDLLKKTSIRKKNIKTVKSSGRGGVINFKGEIVKKNNSRIVVDCGFLFNISLRNEDVVQNYEVGDYVSVDTPTIWIYDLKPINDKRNKKP